MQLQRRAQTCQPATSLLHGKQQADGHGVGAALAMVGTCDPAYL